MELVRSVFPYFDWIPVTKVAKLPPACLVRACHDKLPPTQHRSQSLALPLKMDLWTIDLAGKFENREGRFLRIARGLGTFASFFKLHTYHMTPKSAWLKRQDAAPVGTLQVDLEEFEFLCTSSMVSRERPRTQQAPA